MEEKFPFEKEKEIKVTLEKSEEVYTNPKQGTNPKYRKTKEIINYGIININKPRGPTSHQVTDYVKKILNIKKAGHSGTLDPNVTGCLVIALGNSTRVVQNLLKAGKEYICIMHLHNEIDKKKLKKVLISFTGKINQLPPKKSAVKRIEREREIYYLNLLEIDGRDILFKIGCEAGTYIRKLCHDIGLKLNTGAHMVQLIRTRVGPFSDKGWCSLYDLKDSHEEYKDGNEKELRKLIQPVESAIKHLPKIWVKDSAINSLCHGASLATPGAIKINKNFKKGEIAAVLSLKDELICTGIIKENYEKIKTLEKGIIIETKKVFMKRNTYE